MLCTLLRATSADFGSDDRCSSWLLFRLTNPWRNWPPRLQETSQIYRDQGRTLICHSTWRWRIRQRTCACVKGLFVRLKSEPWERYYSIQVVCSNTPCNDQSCDRISSADLLKRNLESNGRLSSFVFDTSPIFRLFLEERLSWVWPFFRFISTVIALSCKCLRFELINEFLCSPHQPSRCVSYLFHSPCRSFVYFIRSRKSNAIGGPCWRSPHPKWIIEPWFNIIHVGPYHGDDKFE